MSAWTVGVISPQGYDHSAVFNDVAFALAGALQENGHEIFLATVGEEQKLFRAVRRTIVLGANLIPHYRIEIPDDAILFNLEQIGSYWFTAPYLDLLRAHEVWDYSPRNIEALAAHGINAKLCRIGYHPALARIESGDEPLDVLFYGSNTERRIQIIRALCDEGINVQCLFGSYGRERDDFIGKAKLILNLHSWNPPVPWEIVRMQLLFANRKCVVSEGGMPGDLEWETYRGCVAEIDPSRPADAAFTIRGLLADQATRFRIGKLAFDAFSSRPQSAYLPLTVGDSYSAGA